MAAENFPDHPSPVGLWQMLHAEFEGERAPELVAAKTTLELATGRYTVRFDGEIHDAGTYAAANGNPHALLTLQGLSGTNAGRTIPAIYQCVRDRLRIGYGLAGSRPTGFTTAPGSQLYVATYRRITS